MYSTIQSSISRGSERKQGKYLLSKISRKCVHGRKCKQAYTCRHTHTQTNKTIHWEIGTNARSLQKREPSSFLISPSPRTWHCWQEKQINKDRKRTNSLHSSVCFSVYTAGIEPIMAWNLLRANVCLVLGTLYLFNKRESLIERRTGLSQKTAHPSQMQAQLQTALCSSGAWQSPQNICI